MSTNGIEHETKIEQVAKAIWEANAPPGAPYWDGLTGSDQYMVEIIAIECIKAMKKPTKAMVTAAADGTTFRSASWDEIEACWNLMIETALNEV